MTGVFNPLAHKPASWNLICTCRPIKCSCK